MPNESNKTHFFYRLNNKTADDVVSAAHAANEMGNSTVDIVNFKRYLSIRPQMYDNATLRLFSLIDKVSMKSLFQTN